ncbi:uncharacterized protein [Henckelia pumila]|uniref:uncharacterized protein n=1 Tax=Henckelia pumila TaxID=405737 RepID=UPI003C6E67CE
MARIESAFRAFECTEEQKLEVLDFVLDGRARLWWDSKAAQAHTERGRVTWEDFRQQFQRLYFPPVVRPTRSMELLTLRHGSMTIDEYQQRFIDLLPYSLHINESDASKYDIFLKGLNQDIYSQVVVFYDPTSYETLVNRCRQVENSNIQAQLMMSGQPSGFLGPRAQYIVQSACRKASGACFICGEQGHLRRDCPTRMRAASGSGSQAGSQASTYPHHPPAPPSSSSLRPRTQGQVFSLSQK